MGDTIQLNTQRVFAPSRPGVIKANALNELAVTGVSGIRYYHVKKRAFLGTASRQSNNDHVYAYVGPEPKRVRFYGNLYPISKYIILLTV
jgi:hypothetical protein